MNLSQHFTLRELTVSETAARQAIDNTPDAAVIENLRRLAALLEQIRALVKRPVNVSSGYRSLALNKAVGGSGSSAHVQGLAADINVNGLSPKALAKMIADSEVAFDQLILEYDAWVHVGLAAGPLRQQVLTVRKGMGYQEGLV